VLTLASRTRPKFLNFIFRRIGLGNIVFYSREHGGITTPTKPMEWNRLTRMNLLASE